jgi:putative FmdB family regulatory protein
MPIYEFQCPKCDAVTEQVSSIYDSSESIMCDKCGGIAHKIISQTTFRLKGDGWYSKGGKSD